MLPWRSDASSGPRPDRLPLPGARMPLARGGRPLKRWRWVGVFGPHAMACVGFVRVGGVPQAWWAVWHREAGWLRERTFSAGRVGAVPLPAGGVAGRAGDCFIDLPVDEIPGVESVCRH